MVEEPEASLSASARGHATRCGYVTLLGAPNAGKSTLLNALVGESLSIVTPKAQTTWARITGIRTDPGHQFIFLDTPGVMEPRRLLDRSLLEASRTAAAEADVLILALDPTRPLDPAGRIRLLEVAADSGAPRIGVVTKVDQAAADAVELELRWIEDEVDAPALQVAAPEGRGLDALLAAVRELLPEGPFLFPEDEIASDPVRFFVAEMVRETIFEQFRDEIPYASFCQVEEFREETKRTYVAIVVFVESPSQKGILVGKGGHAIRTLGTEARRKIEGFLDRSVYLDLWVKVLPGWRRKRNQLRSLGFRLPDDEEASPAPTRRTSTGR